MTKSVKTAFVERESNKHYLAKELFAKWCRDAEALARKYNHFTAKVAQFEWRPNQGVHTELQFCEFDDTYYLENRYPGATPRDGSMHRSNEFGRILFVPDISIFIKGEIRIIFEIKHTSGLSEEKLQRIAARLPNCSIYEIEAEEVLRHDKSIVPEFIECKEWAW